MRRFLAVAVLVQGCGTSDGGAVMAPEATGGGVTIAETGGQLATDGATQATGGSIAATGGSDVTGGSSSAQQSAKATGGSATGGTSEISVPTGGIATSTGGSEATGGQIATGGSSSIPTGGSPSSGGALATGGFESTGGNQATGGASFAPGSCVSPSADTPSIPPTACLQTILRPRFYCEGVSICSGDHPPSSPHCCLQSGAYYCCNF